MKRELIHLLMAATMALVFGRPVQAQGQNSAAEPMGVMAELRMAMEVAPMRGAAENFIARAMAGDGAGTQALFSRTLVERTGAPVVQRVLAGQILPFFAQGRETGRSVTVTRTTDASGAQGFAFYMWLLPADGGAARPFAIYTVMEQGRAVVANVVPDRFVQGRHQ